MQVADTEEERTSIQRNSNYCIPQRHTQLLRSARKMEFHKMHQTIEVNGCNGWMQLHTNIKIVSNQDIKGPDEIR